MFAFVSVIPPLVLDLPGGDGEGVAVFDPLDVDDIFGFGGTSKFKYLSLHLNKQPMFT